MTLGVSGLWLGTRTGARGTATLAYTFLSAVHGSMDGREEKGWKTQIEVAVRYIKRPEGNGNGVTS